MRKFIFRLILIAFAIELVYLVLVNIFINTSIGPYIVNQKPEKFQVLWSAGWSVIPGQFSAADVKIRAQTASMQWYLEVDSGELWIKLWKLPIRHFEASAIAAEGLSFFGRRRLSRIGESGPSSLTPDIPGLSNPPDVTPETLHTSGDRPWHIKLEEFSFARLREVWVQQLRLTGEGHGRIGRFAAVTFGGANELEDAVLELSDTTVQLGGQTIASQMQLELETTLAPVVVEGASLDFFAEHVSGRASIAGRVNNLDLLNSLYQSMPLHVHTQGQIGMTASLEFENGRLSPGSELLASAEELTVKYLHYTVEGKGILRGGVSRQNGNTLTALTLVFDDFALADDANAPFLRDRGFELVTNARDVGLANSGQDLRVVATLPESFIPDVTRYNDYIPSDLGIELKQGSGRLLSQFEFSKDEETIAGEIKLALTDVLAKYETVTVSGHVDVHTVVKSGDLKTGHFDGAGTRFEFNDITVTRDGAEITSDWWSKITLGKTKLDFKPSAQLSGGILIRMSDSSPILAIFEEREDLPSWIKDELNLENLEAEARLTLSNRVLNVTDFELNSGNWTLLGDLVVKPGGREGILYIKHGDLGLAIVRRGEQKKVKLLYGQDWFDRSREEFRAAHGLP